LTLFQEITAQMESVHVRQCMYRPPWICKICNKCQERNQGVIWTSRFLNDYRALPALWHRSDAWREVLIWHVLGMHEIESKNYIGHLDTV